MPRLPPVARPDPGGRPRRGRHRQYATVALSPRPAVRAPARTPRAAEARAKQVIYLFLSGGLAQHDSFDLKPDAPDTIRGEFRPIATRAPGLHICEHLPLLAQRSQHWALCRSLTHPTNNHSKGHAIMLTGRPELPP